MQNILKNTYYLIFVITIGVILTILLSNKIPIEIDEHIQYWTFRCNYYNSANKNLIYISSKDSDILYHLKNKFKKRHNLELKILKHPKYKLGNYIIGYVKVVNNH